MDDPELSEMDTSSQSGSTLGESLSADFVLRRRLEGAERRTRRSADSDRLHIYCTAAAAPCIGKLDSCCCRSQNSRSPLIACLAVSTGSLSLP